MLPDLAAPRGTREFSAAMVEYRKTGAWVDLSRRLVADAGVCQVSGCAETAGLSCHHWTYERAGRERDSDLVVMCWPHHSTVHHLEGRLGLLGATVAVLEGRVVAA